MTAVGQKWPVAIRSR